MSVMRAGKKDLHEINSMIVSDFPYKKKFLTVTSLEERLGNPLILVLKKIVGGKLAGFLDAEMLADGTAIINAVSVKKPHRRRGIGGELLVRAIEEFRDSGIAMVSLLVKKENDMAKRLYASHGFEFFTYHERRIEGSMVEVWKLQLQEPTEESYLN